jgi:hypothetical protein
MPDEPKLKIIPAMSTDDPFDPANLSLGTGESVGAKKVLLKVPARKPGKTEFFRSHPDPAYCIATALLLFDDEFHVVMPGMRGDVAEALPYELRFCINRAGAPFWWPIRLPGEDGKSNHWWDSARQVADHAKEHWVRCVANRAANMYDLVQATIPLPDPDWPDRSIADLLRLAFSNQVVDSPDAHVLKVLRGQV